MSVFELHDRETFMFTAENPTAARNGGSKEGDCSKPSAFVEIAPGQTVTIADAAGPGVITHIWVGQVSRSVILRVYWDGAESPSVEAPLSAFFGRAYDENVLDVDGRYTYLNSALLLDAPASAVNAYFEMPFRRRCLMTLENRSGENKIIFYAVSGWRGEIPASAGYFHAVYRQEKPVTKGRAYTVLDVSGGKGRFLGMTLAAGMNGTNSCWVEGETKIYLDGDVYPTLNYTGTEDYFCGAYAFGNDSVSHRYQTYSGLY
nr:DUF2961 domain-containing protein [Clostridiales bacterium]